MRDEDVVYNGVCRVIISDNKIVIMGDRLDIILNKEGNEKFDIVKYDLDIRQDCLE